MAKAKPKVTKTRYATQPGITPADTRGFVDPATLPDRYIMVLDGVCMEPLVPNGTKMICAKNEKVKAGDLAIFYFRPECIPAGENPRQCKRLVLNVPPFVKFPWRNSPNSNVSPIVAVEMLNPRQQFIYGCNQLLAIHKCVGPVPEDAIYDKKERGYYIPSSAIDEHKAGSKKSAA